MNEILLSIILFILLITIGYYICAIRVCNAMSKAWKELSRNSNITKDYIKGVDFISKKLREVL